MARRRVSTSRRLNWRQRAERGQHFRRWLGARQPLRPRAVAGPLLLASFGLTPVPLADLPERPAVDWSMPRPLLLPAADLVADTPRAGDAIEALVADAPSTFAPAPAPAPAPGTVHGSGTPAVSGDAAPDVVNEVAPARVSTNPILAEAPASPIRHFSGPLPVVAGGIAAGRSADDAVPDTPRVPFASVPAPMPWEVVVPEAEEAQTGVVESGSGRSDPEPQQPIAESMTVVREADEPRSAEYAPAAGGTTAFVAPPDRSPHAESAVATVQPARSVPVELDQTPPGSVPLVDGPMAAPEAPRPNVAESERFALREAALDLDMPIEGAKPIELPPLSASAAPTEPAGLPESPRPIPSEAEPADGSARPEPPAPANPAIEMRVSRYAPPPRLPRTAGEDQTGVRSAADELFTTAEGDRSPASWYERLVSQARGAARAPDQAGQTAPPSAAHAPSDPTVSLPQPSAPPQPTPLREETRRFLAPLVGIDPATVPVRRDAMAGHLIDDLRADAVTDGQTIYLPATFSEVSPEGRGLLAHELTHAARARSPRYVPPVLRSGSLSARTPTTGTSARHAGPERGTGDALGPGAEDDEALAVQTEAAVRWAARAPDAGSPPGERWATAANSSFSFGDGAGRPVRFVSGRSTPVPGSAAPPATRMEGEPVSGEAWSVDEGEPGSEIDWGGLPTPWEPLPDWLAPPRPGREFTEQPAPTAHPAVDVAAPLSAAASTPAIHRADVDRAIEEEPAPASPAASVERRPESNQPVEPDLDALAQQVYGVLRRRLAVEARRSG